MKATVEELEARVAAWQGKYTIANNLDQLNSLSATKALLNDLLAALKAAKEQNVWDAAISAMDKESRRGLANWLAHSYEIVGFGTVYLWRSDLPKDTICTVKTMGDARLHKHSNKEFFDHLMVNSSLMNEAIKTSLSQADD